MVFNSSAGSSEATACDETHFGSVGDFGLVLKAIFIPVIDDVDVLSVNNK